ncbi:Uncharacterized protein TCM_040630 [Theobroma cacao]|uniref:Uncharacterized protein n=1 Tax=Theobroma cacao TaxID=3641 RepID=A0A061GSZ6_THECC|nr:Uncharacterized protein TCM_040630 [Theobroma cacao]
MEENSGHEMEGQESRDVMVVEICRARDEMVVGTYKRNEEVEICRARDVMVVVGTCKRNEEEMLCKVWDVEVVLCSVWDVVGEGTCRHNEEEVLCRVWDVVEGTYRCNEEEVLCRVWDVLVVGTCRHNEEVVNGPAVGVMGVVEIYKHNEVVVTLDEEVGVMGVVETYRRNEVVVTWDKEVEIYSEVMELGILLEEVVTYNGIGVEDNVPRVVETCNDTMVDVVGALEVVVTCNGRVADMGAWEVMVIRSGLVDDMGALVVEEMHTCKILIFGGFCCCRIGKLWGLLPPVRKQILGALCRRWRCQSLGLSAVAKGRRGRGERFEKCQEREGTWVVGERKEISDREDTGGRERRRKKEGRRLGLERGRKEPHLRERKENRRLESENERKKWKERVKKKVL